MFKTILIANRGEIAKRIADAVRPMGVRTVAVYSDADAGAPHTRAADVAVRIGGPAPRDSYLDMDAILEAAKVTGAEAIHPGYGFLSENPVFARKVAEAGLTFIGPPPESMERMKNKAEARRLVSAFDVPVVPGTEDVVSSVEEAKEAAARIGYPVLIKPAGGGGGIGMAAAHDEAGLEKALRQASDRARSAFGRDAVYLERLLETPRHIEVQILGDAFGNTLQLFERECSIQRRHQKVVEEAPSPLFWEGKTELLERIYSAAVRAAKAFGYSNAGTVEFLVDGDEFYFMEMNARLQVEHPVTELTTGIDLIRWQLRIAAGERLDLRQEEVRRSGAAIELRIYAEDPVRFLPAPGTITTWELPEAEGVRLDAGYEAGQQVTPYYDPLLAKLIVAGASRDEAIERTLAAVRSFRIEGEKLKTNLALHERILTDPAFRAGDLDTHFLEKHARP
ncbi:acetyl-CoA carboxylase biotin carboxylase subunit [Vulgatibacter incomptus]|uniref:Methylcrotonyl-CoA carboxylase biotin-containing subunit n=1 Tax=Vulgatibacter incomptus TaxID=1391653 RepID=A0A0K1PE89_9BACT|nr:biotin carboxylase N-terminal domain-containing protein [Vulgatibacter incomptus]AKU91853.1 Methylcrotonyl-CoA carboxylase biotin-containing subunit [Vulgatibacter incomptus]